MPLTATRGQSTTTITTLLTSLPDVLRVEVQDGCDEAVLHDDGSDGLPFQIGLPKQGEQGLQGQLDGWWGARQCLDLH